MEFFTSDAFLTIISVVGSTIAIVLALRADIGKRIDRVEKRIDRVEDRARADHQELIMGIGKLKTAVSVLGTKLDERLAPRRLVVQEPAGDYGVGEEPEGGQKDGPEVQ